MLGVVVDQMRELKNRQDQLELAWTDVLDKLLAREERERKRMQKLVKRATEGEPPPEATGPLPDDRSSRLRSIRARVLQNSRGA